jgi:hypothetical protein
MKLAEALIMRADHQKRIESLKHRMNRNAKVQEGESALDIRRSVRQGHHDVESSD